MKTCGNCLSVYSDDDIKVCTHCEATILPVQTKDVTKQDHYTKWKIQPAKYIIENGMDYARGCAIKYLTRFRDKGTPIEDLKKAQHYINMLIMMEEKGRVEL